MKVAKMAFAEMPHGARIYTYRNFGFSWGYSNDSASALRIIAFEVVKWVLSMGDNLILFFNIVILSTLGPGLPIFSK